MALTRAWYRKSVAPWLWLLLPLHALFVAISTWRRKRLQAQNLPKLAVPVIVVGNISVGGTGKTPVTLALTRYLKAQGQRPAIISRGYGGSGPFPLRVTPETSAAVCGDEPLLLARRSGVPVVVAPQRLAAVAEVLRSAPETTVIISDDGLQHYALPRQFEIAVVDAARGLGNGWRLPIGPLREHKTRLESVDAVIINGKLRPDTLPGVRPPAVYEMQLQPRGWRRVSDDQPCPQLPAGKTLALAGIGHPQRFFDTVATVTSRAFATRAYADHYAFNEADVKQVADYEVVLMTEKDATKWHGFAPQHCYYLPVEAELPDAFWQQLDAAIARFTNDT
ncbi:tetraacyldisaccharide 4'-kinase [Pseudidiomarina insulisalsae]|uniref:Tetraacyldisaccharide 4'-kinase n=1 Tax=Pseudidiomarina insulisalsae TaxID=575789 RepID=A0A432YME5_9GAMM|nr:tetraacyldisaccharide 4'-kinase [Pseudidiomarina insulisalsae]RUO62120.1 tetraacyldisaccharide 4'-kinase [Pseudidiomarina insulisalsae]